jgi:hypothetical protein
MAALRRPCCVYDTVAMPFAFTRRVGFFAFPAILIDPSAATGMANEMRIPRVRRSVRRGGMALLPYRSLGVHP